MCGLLLWRSEPPIRLWQLILRLTVQTILSIDLIAIVTIVQAGLCYVPMQLLEYYRGIVRAIQIGVISESVILFGMIPSPVAM